MTLPQRRPLLPSSHRQRPRDAAVVVAQVKTRCSCAALSLIFLPTDIFKPSQRNDSLQGFSPSGTIPTAVTSISLAMTSVRVQHLPVRRSVSRFIINRFVNPNSNISFRIGFLVRTYVFFDCVHHIFRTARRPARATTSPPHTPIVRWKRQWHLDANSIPEGFGARLVHNNKRRSFAFVYSPIPS